METTRTHLPTVRLAAVRETVPLSQLTSFFDQAYGRVAHAVGREGWTIVGAAVAWYPGMPTDTVDLAAGFPVEGAEPGVTEDGIEVFEVPGGTALVMTHAGPYDGLPDAWAVVEEDRAALGVPGRGDFWEEYVTDPSPEGDPGLNLTRLVLPLRTDG